MKYQFTFNDLPSEATQEIEKTAGNNGILAKLIPVKQNGGKTDPKRTNNKPKGLAAEIIDSINQLEKSRSDTNDRCILMINKIIRHPHAVQFIAEKIATDKANDAAKYSIGLQSILDLFDAAAPFAMNETCGTIAKSNAILGRDFLTKKVAPMITTLNLLTQNDDNTYRWASYDELRAACPGKHQFFKKLNPVPKLKAAKANLAAKRNATNPYLLIDASGNVEHIRKPFEGELTKEEAKLIRERDAAAAKSKIIEETRKLKDKAADRELQKIGKELQIQQQQLWVEAELDKTEIAIKQSIQAQKLETFKKPAIVAAVFAVIGLVMTNMDKLPPMPEQTVMQATVPTYSYQAPAWSVE